MVQEALRSFFSDQYKSLKEDKYSLIASIIMVVGFSGYGAYKGYNWYTVYKESTAQIAFSQALEEYNRALFNISQGKPEKDMWQDVDVAFKVVEDQHSGTTYAQYAQLFQANADLFESNYQSGLDQIEKVLKTIGKKSPVWYLLKTKQALIQLEVGQKKEAIDALHTLAYDKDNPQSDTAAFFLGYYFWVQSDIKQVQKVWKPLIDTQYSDVKKQSPWSGFVKMKLKQL